MRLTRWIAVLVLLAGCTDRSVSSMGDDASGDTRSSETAATNDEAGEGPDDASDGSAPGSDTAEDEDGGELDYPDCRPGTFTPGMFECSSALHHTSPEVWSSVACGACLCAWEGTVCERDSDCFDPRSGAEPRCLLGPNQETDFCYLVCEDDDDCPADMGCLPLPDDQGGIPTCWWLWRQPECCEVDIKYCS